jgi:hypothetical protein
VYDTYGARVSQESWSVAVKKSLDSMFVKQGYRESPATEMAREAFRKHVEAAFVAEVNSVKEVVRRYVDEKLSGAIRESMRAAVGLKV